MKQNARITCVKKVKARKRKIKKESGGCPGIKTAPSQNDPGMLRPRNSAGDYEKEVGEISLLVMGKGLIRKTNFERSLEVKPEKGPRVIERGSSIMKIAKRERASQVVARQN